MDEVDFNWCELGPRGDVGIQPHAVALLTKWKIATAGKCYMTYGNGNVLDAATWAVWRRTAPEVVVLNKPAEVLAPGRGALPRTSGGGACRSAPTTSPSSGPPTRQPRTPPRHRCSPPRRTLIF